MFTFIAGLHYQKLKAHLLYLTYAAILLLVAQLAMAAELHVTQNQLPVLLGQYLDHYEDTDATLTIDDILQRDIPWQRSTQSIPTLGMSKSAHWFGIILTGESLLDEDLVLVIDAPVLDRVEFYFIQNNTVVRSSLVGDTIPFSQLDYPYRIPVIPFELSNDGNETRIFFRATSAVGVEVPLSLTTISKLAATQQTELVFLGALFTLFLFSFCVCGILYYFLRDKRYFAYTLFFGSAEVFLLTQTGMGRVWFWGESSEASSRISLVAGCFLLASLCLIGQSISFTSRYRDSINIVFRFLTYAMLPVAVYFIIIPFQQISADNVTPLLILSVLIAFTVLIIAGITALQGTRGAIYLFSSWLTMILAYFTFLIYKIDLFERTALNSVVGESLAIIAALLLLLSIAEFVREKADEFSDARLETKAKGDFLKNVSREFLTPVHLILANSKRLLAAKSSSLDESTRQHMTTVIKQSGHLHNLINDLLEMAELESDSFEPEFQLVEISHFLTEVKDMIAPTAMEKGLEITTQFAAANLLVQTDKSRLQHALINILTNAIKYTEKGHIRLGYKAVYFRRRLGIEIFIQDTGRGMSEEFQRRLFQEFSREEDNSEKEPQGTGLGLVIVKRMIEKLGGEIAFVSQKEAGSQFFIRLPLRANPA